MNCTRLSGHALAGAVLTIIIVTSNSGLAQPAPEAPAPAPQTAPAAADESMPAESAPSAEQAPSREAPPAQPPPTPAPTEEPQGAPPEPQPAPLAPAPPPGSPPVQSAARTPGSDASTQDGSVSFGADAQGVAASTDTRGKRDSALTDRVNPTVPVDTEDPESWFSRPTIKLELGEDRKLNLAFYGILQADLMYDTTRSYNEVIGSSLVARRDTYEGTVGRTQASARNTRLGLTLSASPLAGLTPSAVLEGDFRGDVRSDQNPEPSESAFYTSPGFRMRLAYLQLSSSTVDLLIGQTWDLFARQNTFNPGSRNPQLRLSHLFGAGESVSVDVAAAAVRPVQRDARLPDGHVAVRLYANDWLGIGTPQGIPSARPASIGISAVARQFDVDAFTPPPTQRSNKVTGRGFAVDALIPIVPAEDQFDRGNKLTLMGLFVTGTGIADLTGANGGAMFSTLPNPARSNPPPEYHPNIDQGLVAFDILGVLSTIDWQAFQIGAEYYLPPIGRVMIRGNYMEAYSENLADLYPRGGAEIELLTHVADKIRRVDADVFWNVTPEIRLGWGGSYTEMEYLDGERPHNWRARMLANYYF